MANQNPSFLAELLHSLGRAMGSLVGISQATHEEAKAARMAAERGGSGSGGGGGGFDVLSGLPAGSGNARSITSMLSGLKKGPPPSPRTRSPVTPGTQGGIDDPAIQQSPTESIARWLGKSVGGIFRKLSGTANAAGVPGAAGAAGQGAMGAGLLVRGGAAAMGVAGAVTAPIGIGMAIYGVSKALQGFAERINDQSRPLRSYTASTNAAFAALDRQQGINEQQMAAGTADSLRRATEAQADAERAWMPFNIAKQNVKNWIGKVASHVVEGVGSVFSAVVEDPRKSFFGDLFTSKEQKEKERKEKLSVFGKITESMILGEPQKQNLNLHKNPPNFGNLANQMNAGMMGLNAPHMAGGAGATFEHGAAPIAGAVGNLAMPFPGDENKNDKELDHTEAMIKRRSDWAKLHPGRDKAARDEEFRRIHQNDAFVGERANDPGDPDLREKNLETSKRRREERRKAIEERINNEPWKKRKTKLDKDARLRKELREAEGNVESETKEDKEKSDAFHDLAKHIRGDLTQNMINQRNKPHILMPGELA